MLWVRGNISTSSTIPHLFLPSVISAVIPILIAQRFLHGNLSQVRAIDLAEENEIIKELKTKERLSILILGVACLLFVPVFKTITHLPPFVGILFGLGVLWFFTEMMYRRKERIHEDLKLRVTKIVQRIDGTTLLFFLGILLAVDALRVPIS